MTKKEKQSKSAAKLVIAIVAAILISVGIVGIYTGLCAAMVSNLVGACIASLGVILCLIGGVLLIATFATQLDDDTDGPHVYGPGGPVI
ncbi:MAG: hypothetical protein HUK12_00010 [Muribaculaceae bacterium]|nr:hypothetical protein [Muribaculaceae bacterium]